MMRLLLLFVFTSCTWADPIPFGKRHPNVSVPPPYGNAWGYWEHRAHRLHPGGHEDATAQDGHAGQAGNSGAMPVESGVKAGAANQIPPADPVTVPEPGSLVLMATAAAGLFALRLTTRLRGIARGPFV
jgi:hypothetical protein